MYTLLFDTDNEFVVVMLYLLNVRIYLIYTECCE